MKNILLFMVACAMVSCVGAVKKESVALEKVDSLRKDSLAKVQAIEDSLALIAWGDTRFGMTKQEVMASKAFGGDKENVRKTGFDEYEMHFDKRFEFSQQNGLRELMDVRACFEENELNCVRLTSLERDASYLDDMIHDCYVFVEKFSKRYGEPYKLKEDVSILDFDEEPNLMVAEFLVGSKGISIILSQDKDEHEYKYEISITNYTFPRKKHKPTKEEIQSMKEADKLRKEVKENSF